jgi:hypothetical protein
MKKHLPILGFLLLCNFTPLWSQAPTNDSCLHAILVNCDTIVYGSTANATADDLDAPTCYASAFPNLGVWYTLVGDGSYVTISTCDSANFDTKLGVYSGSCGSLSCVAGNDDFCGLRSTAGFATNLGVNYYILVHGYETETGNFGLNISCSAPCTPIPANDSCLSAATLTYYNDFDSCLLTTNTNQCAGVASNDGCIPFGNIQDVWFQFTTGSATNFALSLYGITGSDFNYAIYETSCDSVPNACGQAEGVTNFNGTLPFHTYWLRISNDGFSEAGTFELCVSGSPGPPANNRCDSSIVILMTDTCIFTPGSIYMASQETAPIDSCNGYISPTAMDVFYSFVATATEATVHVAPQFDAVLEVYDNCGEARLGCSDEFDFTDEYVQLSGLTIGSTYYARIFPYGTDMPANTNFDICVTEGFVFAGLDNESEKITCRIYPNPANDVLYISSNITEAHYQVTNLLGSSVASGTLSSQIDLSNYASGIYILSISKEDKMIYHTRFIKQ